MKGPWLVAVLSAASAGCSSDVYPVSDIFVEGISQQATVEYLYFRVPDGTDCAGVRIRKEGTRRFLLFVRGTDEAEVDSVAVVSEDYPWQGMLRVEIPIEADVLEYGGEMTIAFEDESQSRRFGTHKYPAAAQSNKPIHPDGPSGRR